MFKKISFIILLSFLFIGLARADTSEKVTVEDVVGRRNIVITNPQTGEKVFLHFKPGCGELLKDQSVEVVISGALNGNSDVLKINAYTHCEIDQVEPFTQKLYVRQFTYGNSEILASDETGAEYLIGYGPLCQAMPQFRESWIFVLQGDQTLAKGDRLYLPDMTGQCSIDRLEKRIPSSPTTTSETSDRQRPTGVTGLKAIVGNGQIILTWNPARDDRGISHYLVSFSPVAIDPKEVPTQDMPNLTVATLTRATVSGLENGQRYMFYVAAVDTSGNRSSDWATAQGQPSDILTGWTPPSDLRLRVDRETSKTFFLRWDRIVGATRYTVMFDVDGKREFSNPQFGGKLLLIRKTPERKGKTLTVTVRASGLYGLIREETINFKF